MSEFLAFFLSAGVWVVILTIFFYLLQIIAQWKLFAKAGEPGWKSLIPIYNYYTLFKITWSGGAFFLTAALMIASALLLQKVDADWSQVLGKICSAGVTLMTIIATWKLSRAYGHGIGYFLGLLFLEPLFILILGLGSSKYKGKQ